MPSLDPYHAARSDAGLVDRSDRARIAIAGSDRASYLQGLLTNDILALAPGAGCYAAYLTPQGRMIADMTVLHMGDGLLIDANRASGGLLVQRLEELVFTEDVQVTDLSETWSQMALHGPRAAGKIVAFFRETGAMDRDLAARLQSLAEHENLWVPWDGQRMLLAASRDLGETGFDLYLAADAAPRLETHFRRMGLVAIPRDTVETLRIEAGRPRFGVDMDEDTIPLEAGIEDRAISFTKGCYVGQEVVIRILHRGGGRVARKLVGLRTLAAGRSLTSLHGGEVIRADGREVGRVTSATFSPALDRWIALGYLHRDFVEPDTPVDIAGEGGVTAAVVTRLPFLARRV